MNIQWLFVGMKNTQNTEVSFNFSLSTSFEENSKEINKEKLKLTSEFWVFFTFQQSLAPS